MIKKIMSTNVKSVTINTTMREVCTMFLEEDLNHIPVVDEDDKIVGMFSMTDAMKMFHHKIYCNPTFSREDLHKIKLEDFMTSDKLYSINENKSINMAGKKMNKAGVNSLLVFNNSKELSGIITTKDLPA